MTRHDMPGRDAGSPTMGLDRFGRLLEAYGGAVERWPAGERAAALALLDRSEPARRARDEAAALDSLLDLAPAEPPSSALRTRILAGIPAAAPVARSPSSAETKGRAVGRAVPGWRPRLAAALAALWPGVPVWRPALALSGALLLGLAIGAAAPPFRDAGLQTGLDRLAFGALDAGETDL